MATSRQRPQRDDPIHFVQLQLATSSQSFINGHSTPPPPHPPLVPNTHKHTSSMYVCQGRPSFDAGDCAVWDWGQVSSPRITPDAAVAADGVRVAVVPVRQPKVAAHPAGRHKTGEGRGMRKKGKVRTSAAAATAFTMNKTAPCPRPSPAPRDLLPWQEAGGTAAQCSPPPPHVAAKVTQGGPSAAVTPRSPAGSM